MAIFSSLFLFLPYFLLFNVDLVTGSTLLCTDQYCESEAECGSTSVYCAANNATHTGQWMLSPSICNCCDYCLPFYQEGSPCSLGGPGIGTTVGRCGAGLTCVEEGSESYCRRMSTPCHDAQDDYDARYEAGTIGSLEERPLCDDKGQYMPYVCVPMQSCFCQSEEGERIFGEVAYPGYGHAARNVMSCECSRFYEKVNNLSSRLPRSATAPRCTSDGNFNPIQCLDKNCYCVDIVTGLMIGSEKVNLDEQPITELSCYDEKDDAYPQYSAVAEPPYDYTTPCLQEMREKTELIQQSEEEGYNIDYFTSVGECLPDGSYGRIELTVNGSKICVDERDQQIGDYEAQPGTAAFDEMDCIFSTGLDIMKTTQIAQYALRLTYSQPANREKMMSRSALVLAAVGLGLSSFSVRQMILHQTRRF